MKTLYLDCFSGISGDMAVGALIDAGVPLSYLRDGLALLGFDERVVRLETRPIERSQIFATKLDVVDVEARARWQARLEHERKHAGTPVGAPEDRAALDQRRDNGNGGDSAGEIIPHEHGHSHEHEHSHLHEHSHDHPHSHVDEHAHEHGHSHGHAHSHDHEHLHGHGHAHTDGHEHEHRSYASIRRMIESSALPERVRRRSLAIFREIGIAEARVHDVELEHVHFHEVGAVDSIADIVAFALCLEYLDIAEVFAPAIPLGSGGFVQTQHGTMPLPAPATLEILKGYPVQLTGVPFELTTPTGAGIVKALAQGPLALETLSVERIGFGAGTRELADRPNLLRAIVGERVAADERDVVTLIECTIDDLNPQIYPHLFERLLGAGAHDVYLTPVLMKKGRPGHVLTVTAPPGAIDELTRILFSESTTIGVRYGERTRRKLAREEVMIETEFGPVRMKRVALDGVHRTSPELDEARRIANARSIPLQSVLRRLQEIAAANDAASEH